MQRRLELLEEFEVHMRGFDDRQIHTILQKIDLSLVSEHMIERGINNSEDKELFIALIKVLQYIYNNTTVDTGVTDDTYDILYSILNEAGEDIVGSAVSDKNIVRHTYTDLRGSLDKVHFIRRSEKTKDKESRKSIEEWIKYIENVLGRELTEEEAECEIYNKFDGLSVVFECDENLISEKALTRGDVDANESIDLTPFFKRVDFSDMAGLEHGRRCGIKTEVVVSTEDFEEICKIRKFKNRRAFVSGVLNSDSPDPLFVSYLTIVPLRVQYLDTKEEFVPNAYGDFGYTKVSNIKDLNHLSKTIDITKDLMKEKYPTDGVVIRLTNASIREALGRKNHINKFEIAYKFTADFEYTKLKEVIFSVGTLGTITPVAVVEPVVIKGNTITNISLGSMDRLRTLNLFEGCDVKILYEIIPYLEPKYQYERIDDTILPIIECPVCGDLLVDDPTPSCVNQDCSAVKRGKMINYIVKMNIPNLSTGTLTPLMQEGIVTCIQDLYRLHSRRDDVVALDGFKDKLFNKLVDGINARKDVYLYELLGSLGIKSIGRKLFKTICEALEINSVNDLEKISFDKLLKVDGVSEITAKGVMKGIIDNSSLIKYLDTILYIKQPKKVDKDLEKVCFTGVRDKEFANWLEANNLAVVQSSFTSKTDILVTKDLETMNDKVQKAIKQNKKILSLEQLYRYYNYK